MRRDWLRVTRVGTVVGVLVALGAASYMGAADLPKGLVLHYSFSKADTDGVVPDQSGLKNNGKATGAGAKWLEEGKKGGAYEFAATDSCIQAPNSPSLNVNQGTFAAWFKVAKADAAWRRIIEKRNYVLCIAGDSKDGKSKGKLCAGINGRFWCYSDSAVADDNWRHAAATVDGLKLKLYVDGKLQAQTVPCFGGIAPSESALTIGMNKSNPVQQEASQSFGGAIDEVMIFNRALSDTEIQVLAGVAVAGPAGKAAGKQFTKAQVQQQLNRLKSLYDAGLITKQFYDMKVKECETDR